MFNICVLSMSSSELVTLSSYMHLKTKTMVTGPSEFFNKLLSFSLRPEYVLPCRLTDTFARRGGPEIVYAECIDTWGLPAVDIGYCPLVSRQFYY